MKMLKFVLVVFALSFVWCGTGYALSADDFLPPAQAGSAQKAELLEVKDEAAVKTEVDPVLKLSVTTASNVQDSINRVIEKPKQGCEIVYHPGGGYVFVATGTGTYKSDYPNPVATRIDQRNAYVIAFMNAKAEMAKTVGEIVFRGAANFDSKIDTLDTEIKSLRNVEQELSESQMQWVRKVLKGFVTYAVFDDGKAKVDVVIVSSPKTRGQYQRNGADSVSAASLNEGINMLIAEIQNGLVPPVGGRVIDVPGTGEVAFVGFGSYIVRKDPEADVQAELDLQAERIAGLRATDALTGIILGDDTSWQANADETTRKQRKDFEELQRSDQSVKGSETEIKEYENRLHEMRNSVRESTAIKSLRGGVLPPGIMRKTFMDDDEYFAYGIAVYVPSVSEAASSVSKEMDDAQIVKPQGVAPSKPSSTKGATNADPALKIKKGPSGVVEQGL
ncbi:hypothetical protein AGMMS50276_04020 [Synergistales bacterium]|nr:hypothetical protein AGMMS50276_04020 [Synergistales bacterium]